jgi:hypothetical protein
MSDTFFDCFDFGPELVSKDRKTKNFLVPKVCQAEKLDFTFIKENSKLLDFLFYFGFIFNFLILRNGKKIFHKIF